MRVIFIDGYNVINSWPNLKKSKNYSYDIARTELTEMLEIMLLLTLVKFI